MQPYNEHLSDSLHQRVCDFAQGGEGDSFDALALDIARYQNTHVAPFQRLVKSRALDLTKLTQASQLPAIPTDVFRLARVAAHPVALDTRVFRTSGTTSGTRGQHFFRTVRTYETVSLLAAATGLIDESKPVTSATLPPSSPWRVLVLAPTPEQLPDSSLGFMCELFGREFSAQRSAFWFVEQSHLNVSLFCEQIQQAHKLDERVLVLGASFAYVHLSDALDENPTLTSDLLLPQGSRLMLTGGFKGKSREIPAAALRSMLCGIFGFNDESIVGEYGMTELSSQAYEITGQPGCYRAPRWMRVRAVDPITLSPVPRGQVGIARIEDLANVDSAVVLQTQDQIREIGDDSFELLGRLPGAVPRGCSLTIEEILG